MTILDIQRLFDTDDKCREALTKLRWPRGVECPRCLSKRISWIKTNKQFDCAECEYHFSVTAGTIFNDSHLPLSVWFTATLLLCEARKGMSALQLKRTIWGQHRGSYKTAWYLCHRIRRAMATVDRPLLDGTVEIDETYVGGKEKGRKVRGARHPGFGDSKKQIVLGIRQRGGAVRFFHAEDAKSGTLAKFIQDNISEDVDVIMTDEYRPYRKAVGKARHETVTHSAGEYVRPGTDIHTNSVESAFSLLKRGIIGTWHRLSAKHLQAYLHEMEFRFDRRNRPDLFLDTLRHMVTADPMTFEELTKDVA
jgi:transposase-like protein